MTPTTYLRTEDEVTMTAALVAAGLLPASDDEYFQPPGVSIVNIGVISVDTGLTETVDIDGEVFEQQVFKIAPGWHVNVYGPLSQEQRALLPVIPVPTAPHAGLWGSGEQQGTMVYQLDVATGYATGASMPVCSGVGLPAGWVTQAPPALVDGEYAIWRSGRWLVTVDPPLPPAEPVPQSVSRAQGKAALISVGLWAGVLSFVADIEDATQKALAEVALHDTQEWRRDSPFLAQAAAVLGLTDEQLDDLFRQAKEVAL